MRRLCIIVMLFLTPVLAGVGQVAADVTYDGFASTAGLTINGIAATAATADGTVLRLTPAQGSSAGSAFSTAKVSTAEFTSIFSFRITDPGGPLFDQNTLNGADGLVFVVQNQANNVGTLGQGIGYEGISPSIGVTFDTWHNPENNDPSQSYVGIYLNGSVDHNGANGPTLDITSPELGAGDRWWSWVVYDGTMLNVYLDRTESTTEPAIPATPVLSYPLDLGATLGEMEAFAGFTSATGQDWENHDVLYWRYTESVVPEPSTTVLVASGALASLVGLWRRRQVNRPVARIPRRPVRGVS